MSTSPFKISPFNMTWSPEYHLPLSGAVNQDIHTEWFAKIDQLPNNQDGRKGKGELEKAIFTEVGSYGRQLGLLLDVLVPVVYFLLDGVDEPDKDGKSMLQILFSEKQLSEEEIAYKEKILAALGKSDQNLEETKKSWAELKVLHKKIVEIRQQYKNADENKLRKVMEEMNRKDPETLQKVFAEVTKK